MTEKITGQNRPGSVASIYSFRSGRGSWMMTWTLFPRRRFAGCARCRAAKETPMVPAPMTAMRRSSLLSTSLPGAGDSCDVDVGGVAPCGSAMVNIWVSHSSLDRRNMVFYRNLPLSFRIRLITTAYYVPGSRHICQIQIVIRPTSTWSKMHDHSGGTSRPRRLRSYPTSLKLANT